MLGYDSISFTEHHFHVEGFELSNNPVLLDLYIGMQTKRLRVGQLGIVLPAQNPIRVAEDIAMLDHMTRRARQRRLRARLSAALGRYHGAADARNSRRACRISTTRSTTPIGRRSRKIFASSSRRGRRISARYQGKYWRVPPGETPWTIEATAKWGGGVENGIVKAVSRGAEAGAEAASADLPAVRVVGAQYPMVRAGGRDRGYAAAASRRFERQLCDVYAEVSGKPLGEGMGVLRDVIIADTDAEAHAALARERLLLRPRMVRAVRIFARDWTIRRPARRRPVRATASRSSARSIP